MTSGLLRLEDSVSVFDEVRVKKEGDLWRSIGLAEEFNSLPCKLRDGLASMQDVVSLFYKAYQKQEQREMQAIAQGQTPPELVELYESAGFVYPVLGIPLLR